MSPSKPVECELSTCIQSDRIDENESAIGRLTREISGMSDRIGHQEDTISGRKGAGIVGAIEHISQQLADLKRQQSEDMRAIRAELTAIRSEREAPARAFRWFAAAIPVIGAVGGAVWWAMTHGRIMP